LLKFTFEIYSQYLLL